MSEKEYFQWRIFYPLTSPDGNSQSEKNILIAPFTLITKLNMLAVIDEKHSRQSSYIDLYYPLGNTDVCLKIHDIEKSNPLKIEIEIRNRQKEQQSALIQHWTVYEIKYPRIDLPDRILSRLDQNTIEKITKYLQIITNEENLFDRSDLSFIKIQKTRAIWQMDDSDREIEESDISLMINNQSFYIPTHWRTISIQTGDHDKLLKTLTTLQIEDDKDLLDYFSYLLSQTHLTSFSLQQQQQQQVLPVLSSEKAYMNLLTMSYAAFIELIQRIDINQIQI